MSVRQAAALFGADPATGRFLEEPPCVARAMVFETTDGLSLLVVISRNTDRFTTFSTTRSWDRDAFLETTVIGIRCVRHGVSTDVGFIPLPWSEAEDVPDF